MNVLKWWRQIPRQSCPESKWPTPAVSLASVPTLTPRWSYLDYKGTKWPTYNHRQNLVPTYKDWSCIWSGGHTHMDTVLSANITCKTMTCPNQVGISCHFDAAFPLVVVNVAAFPEERAPDLDLCVCVWLLLYIHGILLHGCVHASVLVEEMKMVFSKEGWWSHCSWIFIFTWPLFLYRSQCFRLWSSPGILNP